MRSYSFFLLVALVILPLVGHSQTEDRPDLNGFWVATLTDLEDPRWRLEDLLCRTSCTSATFEYARSLLADPRNDARSLQDLYDDVQAYNRDYLDGLRTSAAIEIAAGYDQADDPVNQCVPSGFFEAAGPLPLQIEQHDDHVILRYEYWHTERMVYTDGRDHPSDLQPSRLGHSIGWYDGDALVVQTVGIEPHIVAPDSGVDGLRTSRHIRAIERYTRSEDGGRLEIETTIVDPLILRRPVTLVDPRLWAADVVLQQADPCEADSGEL